MAVGVSSDEACIRYLLEHGADPNLGPPYQIHPVPNWSSILNLAAAFCTPKIFALLLSHGADISIALPLHHAVSITPRFLPESRVPMLEYLLGLGLDINDVDDAIEIADDGRRVRVKING